MIAVLEFIFQSFWTFAGCAILLAILVSPLHTAFSVLAAMIGRR